MKVGIVPILQMKKLRLSEVLALESGSSEWLSRDSRPVILSLDPFFSIYRGNIKFYFKIFFQVDKVWHFKGKIVQVTAKIVNMECNWSLENPVLYRSCLFLGKHFFHSMNIYKYLLCTRHCSRVALSSMVVTFQCWTLGVGYEYKIHARFLKT